MMAPANATGATATPGVLPPSANPATTEPANATGAPATPGVSPPSGC
jgi:hypothetical protein